MIPCRLVKEVRTFDEFWALNQTKGKVDHELVQITQWKSKGVQLGYTKLWFAQ